MPGLWFLTGTGTFCCKWLSFSYRFWSVDNWLIPDSIAGGLIRQAHRPRTGQQFSINAGPCGSCDIAQRWGRSIPGGHFSPMSTSRKVHWDIAALFMGAFAILVWISLLTHDPADSVGPLIAPFNLLYQPDQVAFPENEKIQNWAGYWGALISNILFHAVGVGAYVVASLLLLSIVAMVRQRPLASPLSRSAGWTMVLVALVTLPAIMKLNMGMPVVVGPGGYAGALTSTWINAHFAFAGGLILTSCVLVAGMLLSTEYAVIRVGRIATTMALEAMGKSIPKKQLQANLPQSIKADVPDKIKLPVGSDTSSPPIRIRGKDIQLPSTEATVASVEASAAKSQPAVVVPAKSAKQSVKDVPREAKQTSIASPVVAESDEEPESIDAPVRELKIEGEKITARADESHEVREPRVRNRATKKDERDTLDHLDDTRLPEGAEEYVLPGVDLLAESDSVCYDEQAVEVRRKAKILEQTFLDFGFNVRVVEIETGPVIAQYEIELEAGLRLSKITGLSEDLAIALRVPSVRIVAPIPGKNTVGIEVPNETRQVVRMREVIEESGATTKKMKIPLFLGKDVSGNPLVVDLASLPHLLIAGRTGTGKSVCLNSIISSILMTRRPDEVRMLMIDPKMVELSGYARLPHLMHPVVTDMRKAEAILAWAVDKMEERYALLARVGVRHIVNYNQLGREELLERLSPETSEEVEIIPDHLPFIVIVADEIADLMMTAGKEVEQHIIRLAQKSRAVGIHLILATQKPTVDVITGLIKSNLPARISFQVASRTDSRVVLDEMGADKLLGNGDMLFLWPGTSTLLRGQGTYLSDEEINRVCDHCSTGEQHFVNELVNLKIKATEEEADSGKPAAFKKRDDLYEAAVDVVIREGRGSCSLLQRALGIGYGRAARLIDFMAEDGIVGQYNGSQAREVVISISQWESMRSNGTSNGEAPLAGPGVPSPRKNRITRESGWDDEAPIDSDEQDEQPSASEEVSSSARPSASKNSMPVPIIARTLSPNAPSQSVES
jgi:DNA segregation ATPase FtsK/SpoIIIE, S-DNA-T family